MEQVQLMAESRQLPTKGKNKQLRKTGKLPAIVYGKGIDALPVAVDYRDFGRIITNHGTNVLISLKTPGGDQMVMIREIQKHPVKGEPTHVDFMKVALDEKIETVVPILLKGDPEGVRQGGVLQHQLRELNIKALPTRIPEHIEADISGLKTGESLKVSDINLPDDLEVLNDGEELIALVLAPKAVEEEEEPAEGAAEPELVTKEKDEE